MQTDGLTKVVSSTPHVERQVSAPKKNLRLLELDALRGLAALAVVLFHYTVYYGKTVDHADNPWFRFSYGHYGVMLFFMISGFVILMTLDRTKTVWDFAVARFCRLYPVYWAAMLFDFHAPVFFPIPGSRS